MSHNCKYEWSFLHVIFTIYINSYEGQACSIINAIFIMVCYFNQQIMAPAVCLLFIIVGHILHYRCFD